jgi:GxxExxY protein
MDTGPAAPASLMPVPSPELTHRVIGAMYYVHNALGPHFPELVYEAAMAKALRGRGLTVERQHPLDVWFEDEVIATFRADLVVERQLLVELKAVGRLLPEHDAQVLNYLRASRLRLGLLANFAGRQVELRRLIV